MIQAEGHAPAILKVDVPRSVLASLSIRPEAGMTVSGRVVDEGNKPVPGASIRFQFRPSTQIVGPSATSGQDGRFQIDGIPAYVGFP